MPQFNENVELLNASGITVQLTNDTAKIVAGGNGTNGTARLYTSSADNKDSTKATVNLEANAALISCGGQDINGKINVKGTAGTNRVSIEDGSANVNVGGNGANGDLYIFDSLGDNSTLSKATIHLTGNTANITAGGNGKDGDITLKNVDGMNRARIDASNGNIYMGGNGVDGDLFLFREGGDNVNESTATIHLDGENANAIIGGTGVDGDLFLFRSNGNVANLDSSSVHIDGEESNLIMGGNGTDGDVFLFKSTGGNTDLNKSTIHLDGEDSNLIMGGNGTDGDVFLFKSTGGVTDLNKATIHLDGESGNIRCNDVIIPGADFAEDFDIDKSIVNTLEPGTVMVLGKNGTLVESTKAFDRKVAGVISGAGKYRPGIVLDKQPNTVNRMPVALSGKVMVKIDANYGSIEVGDLITTSPRKGYAMKATDPLQSFGAVIGKALADFPNGEGLLPILVVLQ